MKPGRIKICAEFAPQTQFELRPAPPVPFRAALQFEFERLKNQLLAQESDLAKDAEEDALLRRAANEAAALAWSTVFPLLFFPMLFDEKLAELSLKMKRQKRIYEHNPEPFSA